MPSPYQHLAAIDGSVDFRRYMRPPRLPAAHCMPVALLLSKAAPRDLNALERDRLERVLRTARDVQNVVDSRSATPSGRVRPRLDELGRAWACGATLLDGFARLDSARGARAAVLQSILLRGGLSFLSDSADAIWFEADRRLGRLRDESSREELVAIIGDEATAWMERTTRELGDAIGCGCDPVLVRDTTLLARTIRELQRAIVDYARALSASVSSADPRSAERFRRAVAPLDDFRAARARRRARASEESVERAVAEPEATPETSSR